MKLYPVFFSLSLVSTVSAAVRQSASNLQLAEAVLPGRARLSSVHFTADTACSPVGGSAQSSHFSARFGFAGQLYEVRGGTLTATPSPVPETTVAQLKATVDLDDGTVASGPAAAVLSWEIVSGPIVSITPAGLATTASVPADTTAVIRARVAGATIEGEVPVRDSIPDNFGPVAGDGIPDAWQYAHFDTDHDGDLDLPAGPKDDADSDGEANLAEWTAGTGPVNGNEMLRMELLSITPEKILFRIGPVFATRTYIILTSTDLATPPEKALILEPTADAEWLEATLPVGGGSRSFFRLSVEME